MKSNKMKPLGLAGLLDKEDKESLMFTLKVATTMMYARKLGKQARQT